MQNELDDENLRELTGTLISRHDDDFRDVSEKKFYDIMNAQFNHDHVVQMPYVNDPDGCIIAYRENRDICSFSSERDLFWTMEDIKSKRHLKLLKELVFQATLNEII